MNVNINFHSLKGEGFAGFLADSVKMTGEADVIIDIDAMLNCVVDNPELSFKQIFTESVLHEILHGVEELFDKSFDEEAINNAVLLARRFKD